MWENEPLEGLARSEGQLRAYRHDGFWQAMDTLRDKNQLEALWAASKAPVEGLALRDIASFFSSPPALSLSKCCAQAPRKPQSRQAQDRSSG